MKKIFYINHFNYRAKHRKFNYFCKGCRNFSWNINSDIPRIVSDRIKKNPKNVVMFCDNKKCSKTYYFNHTELSSRGKKYWTKFMRIGHFDPRIYKCMCGEENFIFIWYLFSRRNKKESKIWI